MLSERDAIAYYISAHNDYGIKFRRDPARDILSHNRLPWSYHKL